MEVVTHWTKDPEVPCIWFAETSGRVFGRLYWYTGNKSRAFMDHLSVEKESRKKGLGLQMQKLREERAFEMGFENIWLWVVKDSWMVKWYERRGFVYSCEYPKEKAIWMKKKLEAQK